MNYKIYMVIGLIILSVATTQAYSLKAPNTQTQINRISTEDNKAFAEAMPEDFFIYSYSPDNSRFSFLDAFAGDYYSELIFGAVDYNTNLQSYIDIYPEGIQISNNVGSPLSDGYLCILGGYVVSQINPCGT